MCQDCVCLRARVPRRRQTLAALSELTGPSPLPLLVAQGGRERERKIERERNGRHCGSPQLSLQFKTHDVRPPPVRTRTYIVMTYLHRNSACAKQSLLQKQP